MSADSQQIDITPYKVRRENVITSNQQRVWEPKPTTDLASSILDKLTEIRGNLYPTHLNIPPHRSIPSQSATPQGYSYLSTSLAPQETGALISNLDLLAKKDIYTHSDLSHSIDPSPTIISGESPLLESSHIGTNYQSLFETTAFKNVEIPPHKTTEAGTIPRIELNFASTNHYDHSSYLSKPALYEPMIAHSNTQPVTEFSSDFTSQTLSPTNLEKNVLQVPSYFEHTKSNSAAGYSGTTFQVSDILKAGPSNIQDPTNTKNALYIPIARNTSYSPEPTLTNLENKSNPTSTRATQTRVHINTSTRLPSVRKTPSRAQLINSLNEALKMGHNETVDTKSGNVVQSRRFEKSVEIPKKTMSSADVGEKVVVKAKNKSTVVLANIIGQNQGMESKRFSFGQLNNEQSDGVPQSERSDYSQKDRDIQEFINNVSRNQVIRAQTLNLKKKAQNAASSSNVENSVKGTLNRANSSIQTSSKNIGVEEVQTRSGGVDFQGQFHGEYKKSVSLDNQNKFQRESRKTLSMENATRDAGDQLRKEKRATPPLSNKYQEVNDGDQFEIGTKKDEVQEDNQSEYSEQAVQENRSQDATRRTLHFEDHVVQPFNQAEKTKSRSVTISQLENQPSERVSVVTQHEVQAEKPKSRGNARNLLEISQSEDKASVAFTKSRPMTRNHLDETRESGLEILQRNPGSRSGSSSPTRSTTPEGFLVKKLEQRNSESPIKNREVNVVSGRESCIEKSVYNEDQERFTEVKKAGNASDGSMSPNRRVLVESPERNSVAARRTQGQQERVEKSEEPEQSENVNSGAQTLNRPSIERNSYQGNNAMNQQMRVQRSPEVMNSSPVRQNFRMVGSPVQVNGMNPGNMNNQMPAGFNVQVPTNYNFQGQMPNFENEASNAEYQKHIMMVMNYYQGHLNHMKNIIVQQNETINQERYKNQMYERKNAELTRTVQNLEQTIKNQGDTLDSNQKDLKTRYEVVMDELAALKRTMLATQLPQEVSQAPKSYPTEGKEYQNLLYHEILSLRKDLESQRSVMYDYRSSTRYLESQMKDLERMYMDEVKSNAQVSHKREQIKESLESYKKDFIKMDTLNQIILDGYERTRKDVNNMKKTQPEEEDVNRGRSAVVTDYQQNQARQRKDLYIASLSPPKYDVEANNQEMLRNKMRAEDCQMKSLMQWNNKNETNSVHYVAHGYMPSATLTSPDHQKQMFFQTNSSQNTYTRRGYSPQPNQSQRVIPTENKPNRSHAVFPSYQKMEDNREQIRRIDQTIVQLEQHKKFVENEIFKMPNIAKSLEQKRKKAGLEMELEGIENQIEECKHQLRQYDVLNTK